MQTNLIRLRGVLVGISTCRNCCSRQMVLASRTVTAWPSTKTITLFSPTSPAARQVVPSRNFSKNIIPYPTHTRVRIFMHTSTNYKHPLNHAPLSQDENCLIRWNPDGTGGEFANKNSPELCRGTPHGNKTKTKQKQKTKRNNQNQTNETKQSKLKTAVMA